TVSRTQHTTNEFQKARVKLTCFLYGFKIQESGQSTSLYNYKKIAMKKSIVIDFFIANLSMFGIY
ncbi:hypothetical protein LZT70_03155, partial [Staphylococcus epidermidis]|uniref:hypothetical protein n=1 Tax=Staphylococcus epidermidis TaxID=1282 RepID=UPI0020944ABE